MAVIEHRVGSVSDFSDGQLKEVEFGSQDTKVLLSKVGGKLYATSPRCTHYGAPLAKGVLTSDGRISCFNVKTGDIEDAPALDNLQKYEVEIRGNDVYVKADEEGNTAVKQGRRKPVCARKATPAHPDNVLIVGGGASGACAAQHMRELGYEGKITVVSAEPYLPIDRIKLSKSANIGEPSKIQLRDAAFWKELDVEFHLATAVKSVDAQAKTVQLSNGSQLSYGALLLATGGSPKRIPIPGADLGNVFTLRHVTDNNNIFGIISARENEPKPKVVIIGSSFIGMEVAATIKQSLGNSVTVIGMESVPFERVLGKEVGGRMQSMHEEKGVKFYMNASVDSIQPKADNPKMPGSVKLKNSTSIEADVVIFGTGIAPATAFLKDSKGFQLLEDGSLAVDDGFKVEGVENVWAVGDIASWPFHYTNERARIEHWNLAENTGRNAASSILGVKVPFDKTPFFWTAQFGKNLRYTGYASSFDEVHIQGSLQDMNYAAFYIRDNKCVAVATMNKDPLATHVSELIRMTKMPSVQDIKAGLDLLTIKP
ncbi:hypothetical protein BZG36_02761 [Bifiguratus adelaidae]|uniref:Rieske domain-containing protein n=1 Tax=Bifiguratus adelaidae TaxID=1938954 RepID=A0A261Y1T3_9FUNG|nr:hypothetical protein BZG36_02761 [Bifiguratus adelaidae]